MRLHKRRASSEEQRILDARPELDDCAADVLRCWHDLQSERGESGLIRYTAILAWAALRRWERAAVVLLADVIAYLDIKRAEAERSKSFLQGAK